MMDKILKCFGYCKKSDIQGFTAKTPEGNSIEGYICRKHNYYLGSLVILKVNGEETFQYVQSMPKIKYYEHSSDIGGTKSINAFEKLDGSCLILYPLFDNEGEILEIVPKTRGMPVADKQFLQLYDKIDKSSIERYYVYNKGILFFELYGILNKHEVLHYDTGIDLVLIGCYNNNHFYKSQGLGTLRFSYNFNIPDRLFLIKRYNVQGSSKTGYKIYFKSEKYQYYDIPSEKFVLTKQDAILYIQKCLENLNKQYYEKNGRIATEGVVLNCTDMKGVQKYIKIKPKDIELKHRSQGGIPRSRIQIEVLKYFDDYGSQVEELYHNDPTHHTRYINEMLLEEFPMEYIENSKKNIEKTFLKVWDSKTVPKDIMEIGDELIKEYGDYGVTHCMRMFAQKYPMKKRQSGELFRYLDGKEL